MHFPKSTKFVTLTALALLVIFVVFLPTAANAKHVSRGFNHEKTAAIYDQKTSATDSERQIRDLRDEAEEFLEEEKSDFAKFWHDWKWLIIGLVAPGVIGCAICCICFCGSMICQVCCACCGSCFVNSGY